MKKVLKFFSVLIVLGGICAVVYTYLQSKKEEDAYISDDDFSDEDDFAEE